MVGFLKAQGIKPDDIKTQSANSTETSNEGNNDTSSYEKDIITIVRAEYKVN